MKPNGNGIIEMVDDRSSDRGFFCMDLVGHITDDPQFDGSWEYWHLRFYEAKRDNANMQIYVRATLKQFQDYHKNHYN